MRQVNEITIASQAAATMNGPAIPSQNLFACSAQITATGSAVGTLKLQASDDNMDGKPSSVPSNWSDIPSASVAVSGAGAFIIPKTDLCYQYVRVVYTNTGTGTIQVVFKALGD